MTMKTESTGEASKNCCDGKVEAVSGNHLTTTCAKGNEHHYTVAQDAKVSCDGQASQASDLKVGSTIRMTICQENENRVIGIDCGTHIPELVSP
jgi:hypothetical protein